MADESKQDVEGGKELTAEELDAQGAEQLPDREAMSLVNANVAVPVNAAIAANVLSDGSTAIADATQDAAIDQST
jgi:imidazole glycerol phosphate synthase subunit HisF